MKKPSDKSDQLLAARSVLRHLRALSAQMPGARLARDVECVHQARVASRRLRAALRLFRADFPPKRLGRWRREVRRITGSLGRARDRDVQIQRVREILDTLSDRARRPGVVRLLRRLEQERASAQPAVVRALDRTERDGALGQMRSAMQRMLLDLRRQRVSMRSPYVFAHARRQISGRVEKLLECGPCLENRRDKPGHHKMRIQAKRLRYTMEAYQRVFQGELDEPVQAVRQLQKLLGELHDTDVLIDYCREFLQAERQRTTAYYGHAGPMARLARGSEYLRRQRQVHRGRTFAEVRECWQALQAQGLFTRLAETLRGRAEPPAPPDAAPEQDVAS